MAWGEKKTTEKGQWLSGGGEEADLVLVGNSGAFIRFAQKNTKVARPNNFDSICQATEKYLTPWKRGVVNVSFEEQRQLGIWNLSLKSICNHLERWLDCNCPDLQLWLPSINLEKIEFKNLNEFLRYFRSHFIDKETDSSSKLVRVT